MPGDLFIPSLVNVRKRQRLRVIESCFVLGQLICSVSNVKWS